MHVHMTPRIAWTREHFLPTCLAKDPRNENGQDTARLGSPFACGPSGFWSRLRVLRAGDAARSPRKQCYWTYVWHHRFWLHDFCGFAWRAETRSYVARWTRTSLDARTSLARLSRAANDSVSRRISFRRHAHASAD